MYATYYYQALGDEDGQGSCNSSNFMLLLAKKALQKSNNVQALVAENMMIRAITDTSLYQLRAVRCHMCACV
jgi:hypothetical protein